MSQHVQYSNQNHFDLNSFFEQLFGRLSGSRLIAPLVVVLLLVGVFLTVQQIQKQQETRSSAAGFPNGPTLKFVPVGATTLQAGGTTQVDVKLDIPAGFTVSGVEFQVKGENNNLTIQSITADASNPFPQGLLPGLEKVRVNNGIAELKVGNDTGVTQATDIPLARITVQAGSTPGTVNLMFITAQDKSLISALEYTGINVLGLANPLPITIGGGVSQGVDLSFERTNPVSGNINNGQSVTFNVRVNTNNLKATSAELKIRYNTADFQLVNSTTYAGTCPTGTSCDIFIPANSILPLTYTPTNTIQNQGIISLFQRAAAENVVAGNGVLTQITLKAINNSSSPKNSTISIDNPNGVDGSTFFVSELDDTAIANVASLIYTINGTSTSPTNTPTPTVPPTQTPTPTTGSTTKTISFTITLPGLSSGSHNSRLITISLINANNQTVATTTTNFTFNSTARTYTGSIDLGNLSSGTYKLTMKMSNTLTRTINITVGSASTITVPSQALILGDILSNNDMNLFDYNGLISCFGSRRDDNNLCPGDDKTNADLNDDGQVNVADYDLFRSNYDNRNTP